MNYPDSVQFLYALGNEIKTAKLGLERIAAVLEALGQPQDARRFVHVAGTNGKGSTCAMIEAAPAGDGRRTGLFTSPHLTEPTERIQIDGRADFRRAASPPPSTACTPPWSNCSPIGAIDLHTTYFETVTAMALLSSREEAVDTVVLEVGLGGRLDATNVVKPELSVITPIDFDHEAYLGTQHRSHRRGEGRDSEARRAGGVRAAAPGSGGRAGTARRGNSAMPGGRTEAWTIDDLELDARGSRFLLRGELRAADRVPAGGRAPGGECR